VYNEGVESTHALPQAALTLPSLAASLLLMACPGNIDRTLPGHEAGGPDGISVIFPDGKLPVDDSGKPLIDGMSPDAPMPDTLPPDTVPADTVPCSAYPEKLDKKDNNCNGEIDEGFWANTKSVTYAALSVKQPLCTPATIHSDVCTSGAHRHCKDQGYGGGFGPVEYGATSGAIVCLADALGSSSPLSAIHFICVKHAKVYQVTFATLASHHSGCLASNSFVPACQAAINRYCGSKGHATGFGPVEQSTDAWVVCLDAK